MISVHTVDHELFKAYISTVSHHFLTIQSMHQIAEVEEIDLALGGACAVTGRYALEKDDYFGFLETFLDHVCLHPICRHYLLELS